MRQRYRLFRRSSGTFFMEDRATRRQESLRTKDKESAARLFHAKNEAYQQPVLSENSNEAKLVETLRSPLFPNVISFAWTETVQELPAVRLGVTNSTSIPKGVLEWIADANNRIQIAKVESTVKRNWCRNSAIL